jgi:hypothetical protein
MGKDGKYFNSTSSFTFFMYVLVWNFLHLVGNVLPLYPLENSFAFIFVKTISQKFNFLMFVGYYALDWTVGIKVFASSRVTLVIATLIVNYCYSKEFVCQFHLHVFNNCSAVVGPISRWHQSSNLTGHFEIALLNISVNSCFCHGKHCSAGSFSGINLLSLRNKKTYSR